MNRLEMGRYHDCTRACQSRKHDECKNFPGGSPCRCECHEKKPPTNYVVVDRPPYKFLVGPDSAH